jgi:hypothetical protein
MRETEIRAKMEILHRRFLEILISKTKNKIVEGRYGTDGV